MPRPSSSGGGIRTRDLRVMSPTSYLTAPPRVAGSRVAPHKTGCQALIDGCTSGLEHLFVRRVVTCVLSQMRPDDFAAARNHQDAPELGRVAVGLSLHESFGRGDL